MNRIRAYRRLEGMTQAALAARANVSPQHVSQAEHGQHPPTFGLGLLGYADSRLDIPAMTEPLHRQKASTTVAVRQRAKEMLRLAGEVLNDLAPMTGENRIEALQRQTSSTDDIGAVASELRTWVLGQEEDGPIRDLTAAVERAGVCLVPLFGMKGIDGLSSWVGHRPVIGLDVSVPGDRFRLTLAHELGHLVLHTVKREMAESEANQFAASLLMPDDEFDAALDTMDGRITLSKLVKVKANWGLSVASLVYRAHSAERLSDASYRSLQMQMSRWRKQEPGRFEPVPGQLLPTLVHEHGGVHRCATTLGINRAHLASVVDWRRLRPV